jgi:hypothetical protein
MARYRAFTVANAVMLLLFVAFTVVQWNDPDGPLWMLLYGMAAASCALQLAGVLPWRLAAAIGLIALAWAVIWAPGVIAHPALAQMFASYQMMSAPVEEVRELVGLLIVAAWMAMLVAVRWRHGTPAISSAGLR